MNTIDLNGKPFHFIGIGGIGMSALAYILAKRNIPVSGSDLKYSNIVKRLQSLGAEVFLTQNGANFEQFAQRPSPLNIPQVICSTAINESNSEYKEAVNKGYPIFHRSDLLSALIQDYQSIAVSGTHGKTTTSSLIGYMLLQAGLDPTVIIGGEVDLWGGNARMGEGDFLVAEADESDGSLVKHSPHIGIITNIELDHPDHYETVDQVVAIFQQFASQCQLVIACADCPCIVANIEADITYSIKDNDQAHYLARQIKHTAQGSSAEVWENGQLLGTINLLLSGDHNMSNALSAIAVGRKLGLDFAVIAESITGFDGAKRRFEYKGDYHGATLIDDYAHHPSEIRCTLQSAQFRAPSYQAERIIAIFQPHRYSRTASFLTEFGQCFTGADVVIVTDIYSAGEKNETGIDAQKVVETIKKYHRQVIYHGDLTTLAEFLANFLEKGDLALFLGAGSLNQIIPRLLDESLL